jgi:cell wall-active antibiotic response 4TMS protein YvqF
VADQNGSGRATWFVIAIVLLGVLIIGNRPGRLRQGADGGDHPHLAALMGSAQRAPETRVFTGAEMTAFMGSCALDLTRAQMAPGGEATIDIFAMMGSVTIRVPDGWTIDAHAVPVMGSIRDDRWPAPKAATDGSSATDAPRLQLRGLVMMGSIFIKS